MQRSSLMRHATALGCAFAAAVLAGILFTGAPARAGIDVSINIGNAPPAPRMAFRARPHERLFPGEGVYVVDDAGVGDSDCFRYGGYYWLFRGGYWYRSAGWRGQFVVVHPRYVPSVFYQMPPARWKHRPSGPPGHMDQGSGGPPSHMRQGEGGPAGHMNQGNGGPPGHMRQGEGGPPGHMNQGNGGPPAHVKSGARHDARQGDHGKDRSSEGDAGHTR